jgi:hypothetical protein
VKLRLWFTDHFLFGHDSLFFQPNGEKAAEDLQRELAMEAHRQATKKMAELDRKLDEVTLLACGNGSH